MRARLAALSFLLLTGCRSGLGERCTEEEACPSPLVCRIPPGDAGSDVPHGVCDYRSRAEGEICASASECESALTCSNHFAPGTRYGRCEPKRQNGEPCFADRDCQGGRCAGASGTQLDGTCASK